jgi:hypothetical protein
MRFEIIDGTNNRLVRDLDTSRVYSIGDRVFMRYRISNLEDFNEIYEDTGFIHSIVLRPYREPYIATLTEVVVRLADNSKLVCECADRNIISIQIIEPNLRYRQMYGITNAPEIITNQSGGLIKNKKTTKKKTTKKKTTKKNTTKKNTTKKKTTKKKITKKKTTKK